MRLGRNPLIQPIVLALLTAAALAQAAPASKGVATSPAAATRAPASAGQPELVVGFDGTGNLRATLCAVAGCALGGGVAIPVPDALIVKRSQAKISVIPIGERRHAIHVFLPSDRASVAWQAVITAKPGQPQADVVFSGMTGYVEGEEGLRRGPTVEISEPVDESGTRRILVGEQREELTLCGRPAVLSPKMLAPKDLTLKPAKVQRLAVEERERAVKLVAEPRSEPATSTTPDQPKKAGETAAATAAPASAPGGKVGAEASLLRAVGATSAIGWPVALTDNDPETTWAENRGGPGRGEFVAFRAPSDVPLQSFDFVVRPNKREIAHGVGPEKLWLVTDRVVYLVQFPSDPWKAPGVTWHVTLPAPEQTSCVAIVSESAYGEKPDAEVTLAEVRAQSEFNTASIDNLIGALAGGGPRAETAGTILAGLGTEAAAAVAKAFGGLDEGGRRVALEVLDHAPCTDASNTYVEALLSDVEAHRLHAVDRLRRCGPAAVEAIETALGKADSVRLRVLAEILADVAPDRALRQLVPRLTGKPRTRRVLRDVIGKAARSPKSKEAILELLGNPDLPLEASIDLLRALGNQVTDYPEPAAASIQRLFQHHQDFRTKYLLIGPAHRVIAVEPALVEVLRGFMRTDPSAPLRAEAVRAATNLQLFAPELHQALEDPEVRVRQAAAQTLSGSKRAETVAALSKRLKQDEWPIVRVAAAESLAAQAPDPATDKVLVDALSDGSWLVKSAVADAIGTRKAAIAGEPLLDLFTDKKERFEVRIAAARALGDICYDRALDKLTDAAKQLRSPSPDVRDRAVASSALDALAKLHPTDLASRLEPLLSGKDTPAGTKQAAKAALAAEPQCRVPVALTTAQSH